MAFVHGLVHMTVSSACDQSKKAMTQSPCRTVPYFLRVLACFLIAVPVSPSALHATAPAQHLGISKNATCRVVAAAAENSTVIAERGAEAGVGAEAGTAGVGAAEAAAGTGIGVEMTAMTAGGTAGTGGAGAGAEAEIEATRGG